MSFPINNMSDYNRLSQKVSEIDQEKIDNSKKSEKEILEDPYDDTKVIFI